jgi:hypothetical protein
MMDSFMSHPSVTESTTIEAAIRANLAGFLPAINGSTDRWSLAGSG